jgi:ABC-type antimicrobial peptide transport system permease subunit
LFQTVRAVGTRNILELDFVDDRYALQFADRLLATRIITGFGLLAFLIATSGIYALMAFLVSERSREIGIRMALGAGKADIRRLVIGSSAKLVVRYAPEVIFSGRRPRRRGADRARRAE